MLSFTYTVDTATLKKIGATCDNDSECQTDQCMGSSFPQYQDDFCVCDQDIHCINEYGLQQREVWKCNRSGNDLSYGLHFCESNTRGEEYAITINQETSNPFATVLSAEELESLKSAPVTKIHIPGIDFTQADIIEDRGVSYFSIPYLGEYIAGVYKYAIIVIGIIAVVMMILSGLRWTMSGGDQGKIGEAQKGIAGSLVGLLLAIGSYAILYNVNPELVVFKNLRVKFIDSINLEDVIDVEFRTGENTDAPNLPQGPDVSTVGYNCDTNKSTSSGIGNQDLLGQLDCHQKRTRKSLADIQLILLHEGGKSAQQTVAWWKKNCALNGKCVSTHYFINRDGKIFQLLDELKVASHTPGWNSASIGIDLAINVPGDRSTTECLRCKKNGTCKTFTGREVRSEKTDKAGAIEACFVRYTDEQYAALNTLVDSITSRTGVSKNSASVRAHCNTSGNHGDPRNFDWSKIGLTPMLGNACRFAPKFEEVYGKVADLLYGQ